MQSYNAPTLEMFDSSGNLLPDIEHVFSNAENITYETFYPGGKFGIATFDLPRNNQITSYLKAGYRARIFNRLSVVYEGYIDSLQISGDMLTVECVGAWGYFLGRRTSRRLWADKRIDSNTWVEETATGGTPKATFDYYNRLRITPKAVSWTTQHAAFRYTAPAGETITHIDFNYDLQEAAQNWALRFYTNTVNDVATWTLDTTVATASGTGSSSITLTTPSRYIWLALYSGTTQTPASDGTQYGEFSNITVFSTLNSSDVEGDAFNIQVLMRDIAAKITALGSTEAFWDANTYSLIPFIAERGGESYADILARAFSFGGNSGEAWAVQLDHTRAVSAFKPAFISKAVPALTSYEVGATLADLRGSLRQDFSEVHNYITVVYTDYEGIQQVRTPDDNASLTDTDSVALYGQRDYILRLPGQASTTEADAYGVRYLTEHKTPAWYVVGSIQITDYAQGVNGQIIPASEIQAGQRLRLLDFVPDITGQPFTAIIARTRYQDNTCTIYLSRPDNLSVQLRRLEAR